MSIFVVLLFISISSVDLTHHLHSLPPILFDPDHFTKSDLFLYDFRHQFQSSSSHRCLLQTESKFIYLSPSCQLFTRTSLKSQCALEHRFKLEIVFPQNTTVYDVLLQSNRTSCPPINDQTCQFEKNPYRIKLKENELYENFLQLTTLSSCSASNYILSSTNAKKNFDYFALNSSTGFLTLLQRLDYESTATWKLVIQGEDKDQIPFYTYVIIDVDDVNDCPPLLSWNFPLQTIAILNDTDPFHVEISIDESKVEQKNIIIANLIVSDLDSILKFDLKIDPVNVVSLPFRIDGPYGDSTFVLLTTSLLDREIQDRYVIDLILQDYGKPRLTSFYQLILHILDVNDHRPKFEQDIYYVDIQENNAVNITLLQVFANDSDAGGNGRVTYRINRTDLWIDSQTGVIRTKIRFDYEKMKNFTFDVMAMDHPSKGPSLKSTATVIVNIIDQNDNIPKFSQSIYEFSIYENNPQQSYLGQVWATDGDGTPLIYIFENPTEEIVSLFQLSPSDGKIYVIPSLDREQKDQYKFRLTASDGFHRSSPIEIFVRVLDLNDEIPRFLFPNDQNDTLIIDRTYWNFNDFICQIEVEDLDQIPSHSLMLVQRFEQLKNYDYLEQSNHPVQFDSARFFLDEESRLFFNATNGTQLQEGVYYLAFKVVDGQKYFDEKLLKLIVLNDYERLESVLKQYDYLGLHLNNRFAYLQYHQSKSSYRLSFDQSNKYFLLSLFAVVTLILLAIACLFIFLLKCRFGKKKTLLKPTESTSTASTATTEQFTNERKTNLKVTNCYDYNDASLLMLSKDLINDNSCLLETIHEKDHRYDPQRNSLTWLSSTSHRTPDSSTFQSFHPHLSTEVCPPKNSSSEYAIAVVSSHTPVSSDDGFCGSSDISDPSIPNGNNHLLLSCRQPYMMMKEGILLNKTLHSPSFTSLSSAANGTDTARRVRFNLDSTIKRFDEMYITPLDDYDQPTLNSTIV